MPAGWIQPTEPFYPTYRARALAAFQGQGFCIVSKEAAVAGWQKEAAMAVARLEGLACLRQRWVILAC